MRMISRDDSDRSRHWAGRALSRLAVLFLLFDGAGKLLQVQPVIERTIQLGYPRDVVFTLGVIQLACVLANAILRTSVLGALLLTGYLGGAVATHVRVESPLLTHVLFPTLRRGVPVEWAASAGHPAARILPTRSAS